MQISHTPEVRAELTILRTTLEENRSDLTWRREIGLLVPREPNTTLLSDASYEGLGGYGRPFNFMWRVSAQELRKAGWKIQQEKNDAPSAAENTDRALEGNIHINILEFVSIIINIWCLLKLIDARPIKEKKDHVIALILADNTSALSWLQKAGRTRSPAVRNLAHLLTKLVLHRNFPLQISSAHIPGEQNTEADCLSRFSKHPSWDSLTNDTSLNLQRLSAYQIPHKLLTMLWSTVSSQQTADTSAQAMTRLWRLELKRLQLG